MPRQNAGNRGVKPLLHPTRPCALLPMHRWAALPMTTCGPHGIMEFNPKKPMAYLAPLAVVLLLVIVATLLVGFANLRRHTVRTAEAPAEGPSPHLRSTRRHAPFPLPRPPALPEESAGPVRLVRPFALKMPAGFADSFADRNRR